MKRMTGIILTLALLLSLTACFGESTPTEAPTVMPGTEPAADSTAAPTEAPTEAPAANHDMGEMVIVDDENCTFTITGIANNEHLGMQLEVFCENKTDRSLIFSWDSVSVCGVMYDPFWGEEVAAGKKVNSTVDIDTYQLEQMGISSVDEVSFHLSVIDSENWMDEPFVNESFTVYPTGLTAETVEYPAYQHKNGETIIVDNEDLTFIIENVDDEVSDFYTLRCYAANKTGRNLMLSWDGVSVNGFMVDPFWATVVTAGKQTYTEISFFRSDLEEQGIEEVTQIDFTLTAADYDDWEAAFILEETYTFNP